MRRAEPGEAKKGEFLKSFDLGEFKEMLDYGGQTERAMSRNQIRGEIVYAKISTGKRKKFDTWQVFLLRK